MRNIVQIVLFLFAVSQLNAQELNCTVTINSDKIPGSNKQIFTTLENSLNDFINQTQWTGYNYKNQERINCNMSIIIDEQNGSSFKANLQVQSSRTVYNSNYSTPVFNFKDSNFSFEYTEFEPLVYNTTNFESNLVSMMTYYAYVILGMDADTFSQQGGIPFFTRAQDILVQAQQSGYSGWNQSDGSRTRFSLIDNLLSPAYKEFHTAMYFYHLRGLDLMSKDSKAAKENIGDAIFTLKSLYDARPNAFLLRVFMDSKSDEIVEIFSDGPRYETFELKEDLIRISPLNAEKWNSIK